MNQMPEWELRVKHLDVLTTYFSWFEGVPLACGASMAREGNLFSSGHAADLSHTKYIMFSRTAQIISLSHAPFCSTVISDTASNIQITVSLPDISVIASGRSSKKPTYSIAPAANPRPTGSQGSMVDTSMNTGTATRGWGRLEKIAHPVADMKDTPRGIRTTAMARPSGTL